MSQTPQNTPEWRKAVAQERYIRECAQVGMPTLIAGDAFSLDPLTLRQQAILYVAKNPFVYPEGTVTPDRAIDLLWFLTCRGDYENTEKQLAFIDRVEAMKLPWNEVIPELHDFIEAQNLDAPQPSKAKSTNPTAPAVTSVAIYIDEIAREYGWSREAILEMPVAVLNQQRRCIAMRKPGYIVDGGRRSNEAEKEAVLARRVARMEATKPREGS